MAVSLLTHEISELCLGKPALRCLPLTATVADALAALKSSEDSFLSVWDCHCRRHHPAAAQCRCVGKLSMAHLICFLLSPHSSLTASVSTLLHSSHLIAHLEPSSSLSEAIDAIIVQGAQNLVIPIKRTLQTVNSRKKQQLTSMATLHDGMEFCWLTQEDVIRFLLSSIGLFSPTPSMSVDSLGIIAATSLTAEYHSPAITALGLISDSLADQTSVAVVDVDGVLIGEISPQSLCACDEAVAAAIATLSAGDLMAYIDGGGPPPEDLVRAVNRRLAEEKSGVSELVGGLFVSESFSSSSSSSDDESPWSAMASPRTTLGRRYGRSASYSARMGRRAEAIVCHRRSSLVAVMIQAIAHRVSYVWVVDDGSCLVGIVTFSQILRIFRECTIIS